MDLLNQSILGHPTIYKSMPFNHNYFPLLEYGLEIPTIQVPEEKTAKNHMKLKKK